MSVYSSIVTPLGEMHILPPLLHTPYHGQSPHTASNCLRLLHAGLGLGEVSLSSVRLAFGAPEKGDVSRESLSQISRYNHSMLSTDSCSSSPEKGDVSHESELSTSA